MRDVRAGYINARSKEDAMERPAAAEVDAPPAVEAAPGTVITIAIRVCYFYFNFIYFVVQYYTIRCTIYNCLLYIYIYIYIYIYLHTHIYI